MQLDKHYFGIGRVHRIVLKRGTLGAPTALWQKRRPRWMAVRRMKHYHPHSSKGNSLYRLDAWKNSPWGYRWHTIDHWPKKIIITTQDTEPL